MEKKILVSYFSCSGVTKNVGHRIASLIAVSYTHLIDMVAGPSEVLVIADENANSKYIAADLMSQAEHDKLASALLVTTSKDLVEKVNQELKRQIETLSRKEIIEESLKNYGGAIIVKDIDLSLIHI